MSQYKDFRRHSKIEETKMNSLKLDLSLEYKIKDIDLADWGLAEMELAENEMPGLMSIREKHAP